MITPREIEEMRVQVATARATAGLVDGLALLQVVRRGFNMDEGGLGGFYDDDDAYVEYWRAGFAVASAPIEPSR